MLAERFPADAPHRQRALAEVPTVHDARGALTRPSPRDARTRTRRRRVIAAVGAVALAAVAVVIAGWLRGRDAGEEARLALADAASAEATAAERARRRVAFLDESRRLGGGVQVPIAQPGVFDCGAFELEARRRAEALLGPLAEQVSFSCDVGPGDLVDLRVPHTTFHATYFAATPADDDHPCVNFTTTNRGESYLVMTLQPTETCEATLFLGHALRCAPSEVRRRAITRGFSASAIVTISLRGDAWFVSDGAHDPLWIDDDCPPRTDDAAAGERSGSGRVMLPAPGIR